jgi:prepilin-type N-terminal cleavage/methylation domain-containing protein
MYKYMRNNKGFTLIEVLVVVAIIAILASILLVGLGRVRQQGIDARIISDLRSVANVLELFANKCGFYPGQANAGVCANGGSASDWANLETQLKGAQIGVDNLPKHPSGGTYEYARDPSSGNSYVLKAVLNDPKHKALESSWSGKLGGINCDPSSGEYCVRL